LLFSQWLQEAIDSKVYEPTAMLVGTVSPEGKPSTRTVLLKDLHDDKFIFYSNYESRKGRQLAQNPAISLSFVWHQLERQVHIEGTAEKVPPDESDQYFKNLISWGEPFFFPMAVRLKGIYYAIMKSVGPTLPELDTFGNDGIPVSKCVIPMNIRSIYLAGLFAIIGSHIINTNAQHRYFLREFL